MDIILTGGGEFPEELLSSTELANFTDPTVGTLVPNFFITYFGQLPAVLPRMLSKSWMTFSTS